MTVRYQLPPLPSRVRHELRDFLTEQGYDKLWKDCQANLLSIGIQIKACRQQRTPMDMLHTMALTLWQKGCRDQTSVYNLFVEQFGDRSNNNNTALPVRTGQQSTKSNQVASAETRSESLQTCILHKLRSPVKAHPNHRALHKTNDEVAIQVFPADDIHDEVDALCTSLHDFRCIRLLVTTPWSRKLPAGIRLVLQSRLSVLAAVEWNGSNWKRRLGRRPLVSTLPYMGNIRRLLASKDVAACVQFVGPLDVKAKKGPDLAGMAKGAGKVWELPLHFNGALVRSCLPPSLRELKFGAKYTEHISGKALPKSLQCLQMSDVYNHQVGKGLFCRTTRLRSLRFSPQSKFNRALVKGSLPSTLTCLNLGKEFSEVESLHQLKDLTNLRQLHLYSAHLKRPLTQDQGFGQTFSNVQSLVLGSGFAYVYEESSFPASLKDLNMAAAALHFIGTRLQSLRTLQLGRDADARGVLPQTLTRFDGYTAGKSAQPSLPTLPVGLVELTWRTRDINPLNKLYFEGMVQRYTRLRSLTLQCNFNLPLKGLPRTLTYLDVGPDFNRALEPGQLPPFLLELRLGRQFNQPIGTDVLPAYLRVLKLGVVFNHPLDPGCLPSTLVALEFVGKTLANGCTFNHSIPTGVLPNGLRRLEFSQAFNQSIELGVLPATLERLVFGNDFNQVLRPGVLPANLTYLRFGTHGRFNQQLHAWKDDKWVYSILPPNLDTLIMSYAFNRPLYPGILPPRLAYLKLDACFGSVASDLNVAGPVVFDDTFPPSLHVLSMHAQSLEHLGGLARMETLVSKLTFIQRGH